MKKLLLAAAVMTTFASASAFAQFGAEKEGENTGNITIGGEISGTPFKWVSAIDSNPAGLNSKTAKTVDDWKTAQGGTGYTMDLGLTAPELLVYVRTTGGSATLNQVVPSITFTSANGSTHNVTEGAATVSAKVSMGAEASSLTPREDVTAEVKVDFRGMAASYDDTRGSSFYYTSDEALVGSQYDWLKAMVAGESAYFEGNPDNEYISGSGWSGVTRYSISGALYGAIAGVGYATDAKLKTTATTMPVGFWQASIPVTVAYM